MRTRSSRSACASMASRMVTGSPLALGTMTSPPGWMWSRTALTLLAALGTPGIAPSGRLVGGRQHPSHRLYQLLHVRGRRLERLLLVRRQLDLDHTFDTARADLHGHADIEAGEAVLAFEPRGTGQDRLPVGEVGVGHLDRGLGGRIEGRPRLQERDDLAARLARPLLDRVEPGGRHEGSDR